MEPQRIPISPLNIHTAVSANRRRVLVLSVAFFLLIFALSYPLGLLLTWPLPATRYWAFLVVGVVLFQGVLLAIWIQRALDRWVLAYKGARRVTRESHPELVRTAENLAIGVGLPAPLMYLIDSPWPNAFATGHDPRHASVVVTSGLLERLNANELEGVLAHELSHIASRDTVVTSLTSVLLGLFGWAFIFAIVPLRSAGGVPEGGATIGAAVANSDEYIEPLRQAGLFTEEGATIGAAVANSDEYIEYVPIPAGHVLIDTPAINLEGDGDGISVAVIVLVGLALLPFLAVMLLGLVRLTRKRSTFLQSIVVMYFLLISKERTSGSVRVDERLMAVRRELVERVRRVHAVAVRHGRLSKEYRTALVRELWLAAPTGIAFYPGIAKRLHFGMSREREYLADANAALLTRYPSEIADALGKIAAAPEDLAMADPVVAHLLTVSPQTARFETHPPIEERIARLRAMAGEARRQ